MNNRVHQHLIKIRQDDIRYGNNKCCPVKRAIARATNTKKEKINVGPAMVQVRLLGKDVIHFILSDKIIQWKRDFHHKMVVEPITFILERRNVEIYQGSD